jgi:hypothetical protein
MVPLLGAVVLAFWRWHTLGWHARGIVLALLGAAFLAVFGIQAMWVRSLLQSGDRAEGTAIEVEEDAGDRDTRTTYRPVVQFTTADGRKVVFTGSVGTGYAPEVGSAVPVRYRRDDPDQAEIDRLVTWLGTSHLRGSVGSGVARRRSHQLPPPVVVQAGARW